MRGEGLIAAACGGRGPFRHPEEPDLTDRLQLEVHDLEVMVLTGIYSEETHLPQPLRISVTVDIDAPDRFTPESPLKASKSYIDIKQAVLSLPEGVHFTLVEAVADYICETLFLQDRRVARVEVKIVKLAIAENGEAIGITLVRHRR
jgi:7,8-dihydroneopterin aldolase/epimerase/oxygenase